MDVWRSPRVAPHDRPYAPSAERNAAPILNVLREVLAERLAERDLGTYTLRIPSRAGRLRAQLFAHRSVRAERLLETGDLEIDVEMPFERLRGLCVAAGIDPPPDPGPVEACEADNVKS